MEAPAVRFRDILILYYYNLDFKLILEMDISNKVVAGVLL